jgi:hypothetical protein
MDNLAARMQTAELELIARGTDELTAQNAVSHALGWASGIAKHVSPEIRDQVTLELFEYDLSKAGKYLKWAKEFVGG